MSPPPRPAPHRLGLPPVPPSGEAASGISRWRENLASEGAPSSGAGLFLAEDFRRAVWFLCLVVPTASLLPRGTPAPPHPPRTFCPPRPSPAVLPSIALPTSNPAAPDSLVTPLVPLDSAQPLLRVTPAPKHVPRGPGGTRPSAAPAAPQHRPPPRRQPQPYLTRRAETSPGGGRHGGAGWALHAERYCQLSHRRHHLASRPRVLHHSRALWVTAGEREAESQRLPGKDRSQQALRGRAQPHEPPLASPAP